jgi:hypothetical protein
MRESQRNSEEYDAPDSHVRIRAVAAARAGEESPASAQDHFPHPGVVMNDAILTTATIRNLRAATLTASMGESRYGTPEPQVEVRFLRGTHYRKSSAALHALAAVIELATPTNEGWVVVVDPHGDEVGRVYLELVKGDDAEAGRGLELLKRTIG